MSRVTNRLQKIRKAIWRKCPIFADIMKAHGDEKLFDYAQGFLDVNSGQPFDRRRPELIAAASELIARRLGQEVAAAVAEQLGYKFLLSTIDHHAPIQHPFWLNANIISALSYFGNKDQRLNYLVVFSFSSVSLNNASGYARGLLFHQRDNSGDLVRLPILSDRRKMSAVYSASAFGRKDLDKAGRQLAGLARNGVISRRRAEQIGSIIEKYFAVGEVLGCDFLKEQITKINFRMWPDLFHGGVIGGAAAGNKIPDLIYLEIETLVARLLVQHHLFNQGSLLRKFLFAPECQRLVPEIFNNLRGAFSLDRNWGSYLFWGVDGKQRRVRMFLSNGKLHSVSDRYECQFSPEGIKQSLESGEIFPSMMLCYLVVSLYYGFKCLGGFCQVNDLTLIKLAWQNLLRSIGEVEEADAVQSVQTKELGGDGMVLSYLRSENGEIQPATGWDMILEEGSTLFSRYYQRSKNVTLAEMMAPMLPEMYTVLYDQSERSGFLSELTVHDIVRELKLKEKI